MQGRRTETSDRCSGGRSRRVSPRSNNPICRLILPPRDADRARRKRRSVLVGNGRAGTRSAHEMFAYDLLQLKTWISALGQPIAIEHMRIEPARRSIFSLARLGAYAYFSTFYICRAGIESSRWLELEHFWESRRTVLTTSKNSLGCPAAARAWGRRSGPQRQRQGDNQPFALFWRAAKCFCTIARPYCHERSTEEL